MSANHQAVALFSGGLDSILAVLHMRNKGYRVLPIYFETPFFPSKEAKDIAEKYKIDLKIVDITEDHLRMLQNPRYGFGKNMNPCIDCHGLMFQKAAELMKELNCDYLISGEVVGQRPMSQRRDALNSVAKLSTVKDLLVRPLCQKLLPDTKPIREGWVKKEDMLDIQGRGRYRQLELANQFGVPEFLTPGGGCLLTDEGFSRRLQDLFKYQCVSRKAIEWLKLGRHFRINETIKIVIGRNQQENQKMNDLLDTEILMICPEIPGPVGVIITFQQRLTDHFLKQLASLFVRYHPKINAQTTVQFRMNNELIAEIEANKMSPETVKQYQL